MSRDAVARTVLWACLAQMALALLFAQTFPPEPGLAADPDRARSEIAQILEVPPEALPEDLPDMRNSAYGDAGHYLRMAMGGESIPPYSLRPVYPALIGGLAGLWADPGLDPAGFLRAVPPVVRTVNLALAALATVALGAAALRLGAPGPAVIGLSGLMAVNVGTVQTWSFAMPDIASYAVAAAAILCFALGRWVLLAAVVAFGVLVKDVLIVYAALSLYPVLTARRWGHLALAALPLAVFVALRLASDVDPLSVQYGWNVSRGEISLSYLTNHLSAPHVFAAKVAFALAAPVILALWLAPPWRDALPRIVFAVLAAVLAADLLLATRVSRIVFVAYPALALLIAARSARTR